MAGVGDAGDASGSVEHGRDSGERKKGVGNLFKVLLEQLARRAHPNALHHVGKCRVALQAFAWRAQVR